MPRRMRDYTDLVSDKMDRKTLLLLLFLLVVPLVVRSYEVAEEIEFPESPCPAFLTYFNAAFVSGTTVELPCLCKPPEVKSVVWFFRKHLSSSEATRVFTDDDGLELVGGRSSMRMFNLLIHRSSPADSGIYICGTRHRDFFYAYDLDIQEVHKITFFDRILSSRSRKHRTNSKTKQLYKTFNNFEAWSMCDRCGRPAEQVRVGLCYVHSHYLHARYQRYNSTVVSCGSGAVLRVFGPVKNMGVVLEVRDCEEECKPEPDLPSKVKSVMRFLGYGSDKTPATLKIGHVIHRAETSLSIPCPGVKPNMVVAWDREDAPIFRRKHIALPGVKPPRISIDTGNNLVFNPAQENDSGVYYCWLQGKKQARIHLFVYSLLGRGQSVLTHPDVFPAFWMVVKSYACMISMFLLLMLTKAWIQIMRGKHRD